MSRWERSLCCGFVPYLITACKKTITSCRITTFCTLHGGFEMEPSFSSLSSLYLSLCCISDLILLTWSALTLILPLVMCVQHCWCLQQLCMPTCISTVSNSAVKVCKTVASLDECQVKVIVSSCFCLYALQACLNLLRCLLMQ